MLTPFTRAQDVKRKWIIIDANNLVVGRLAAIVASMLKGKNLAQFTPHVDNGYSIIIINAERAVFTGKKLRNKTYYWHTGYPGGLKSTTPYKILIGKHQERVVEMAIKRMVKTCRLGRDLISNLYVYAGSQHPHQGQQPEKLDVASLNSKNSR